MQNKRINIKYSEFPHQRKMQLCATSKTFKKRLPKNFLKRKYEIIENGRKANRKIGDEKIIFRKT